MGNLWIPGLGGGDIIADSERLLQATHTIKVATGIISIWPHDTEEMAAGHAGLQQAYGRRMLLGRGVSDPAAAHDAENRLLRVPDGVSRPLRRIAGTSDIVAS